MEFDQLKRKQTNDNQNLFYGFLYNVNSLDFQKKQINTLLYISNFILVNSVWASIYILNLSQPFVINITFFYVLIGFMFALIIQMFLGIFYKKYILFELQCKIFRFIFFNLLLRYCFNRLQNYANIETIIFSSIIIISTLICIFINYVVIDEGFEMNSMYRQQIKQLSYILPKSLLLIFYECIVNSLILQNTAQLLDRGLVLVLLVIIMIYLKSCWKLPENYNFQSSIFTIIIKSNILISISMIIIKLCNPNFNNISVIILIIFFVAVLFISDFLQMTSNNTSDILFQNIESMQNNFINFMDEIIKAIQDAQKRLIQKTQVFSPLISFIYHHIKQCEIVDCPLKIQLEKKELSELINDQKQYQKLISKVIKKIQYLFEEKEKAFPQNFEIKLCHVKFIILYSKKKIKGLQLISDIQDMIDSHHDKYLTFFLKKKLEFVDTGFLSSGEQTKLDQNISLLRYDIYFSLNLMIDFWSQFFEERVDLNKLLSVSAKLFPFKIQIQKLWSTICLTQSFTTAKTMLLYSQYLKKILNDTQQAENLQEQAERMISRLKDYKTIRAKQIQSNQQMGAIILSLNESNLGQIKQINNYACQLFGYSRKQAVKKKINNFMPVLYAIHHDDYLQKFINNKKKKIIFDERYVLAKHKNGALFPILIQLRRELSNYNEDILFIATIKQVKFKNANYHCILDEQGKITDMSHSFRTLFKLEKVKSIFTIQKIIKNFWDQISSQNNNKIVNQYLTKLDLLQYGYPQFYVDFYVTSIDFIAKQNAGYIVRGELMKHKLKQNHSLKKIEKKTNVFEFEYGLGNMFIGKFKYQKSKTNQIDFKTLPNICLQKQNQIRQWTEIKRDYGQNIRIFRLIDNEMVRVEQNQSDQSFSEYENNNQSNKNYIIESIKENIFKKKQDTLIRNSKYFTHIFTIVFLVLLICNFQYIKKIESQNLTIIHNNTVKTQIQTISSYLVSHLNAQTLNFDLDPDLLPNSQLQTQLQQLLNNAYLSQDQKQTFESIIVLQKSTNMMQIYKNGTFQMNFQNIRSKNVIYMYGLIGLVLFGCIVYILIERLYEIQQINLFSIFLTLEQKLIKSIYNKCSSFIKKIQRQNDKYQQSNEFQINQLEQQDDQSNCENRKLKKLKNCNKINTIFIFKIILISGVVITIFILIIMFMNLQEQQILSIHKMHQISQMILPQSSILLMKDIISFDNKFYLSNFNTNYLNNYQMFEQSIFNNNKYLDKGLAENLNQMLFTTICNQQLLNISTCQNQFNGILNLGGSKGLNYFTEKIQMIQLQLSRQNFSPFIFNQLKDLMRLQYVFLKPFLDRLMELQRVALHSMIIGSDTIYESVTIILIIIVILTDLIICKYVLDIMLKELILTKGLVALIPKLQSKTENEYVVISQVIRQ